MTNKITLLFLSLQQIKGIGNVTIIKALRNIPKNKINLSFKFLQDLGINRLNKKINNHKFTKDTWFSLLNTSKKYLQIAHKGHVHVISCLSKYYPLNLKAVATHKYPVILYVKGNLNALNMKAVAIVGTRHPSAFGASLTKRYATYFAKHHYAIIAGLAIGTDTNAQSATIKANGVTIAVMATGLDQPVYPKRNTALAKNIIANGGALVSTYPLGTVLKPQYLASRDQWQSGLANGEIAVEAGLRSGTCHTMSDANEQGKLLAVPDISRYLSYMHKDPYNIPLTSQGTQQYLQKQLALPLFSRRSVYNFNHAMQQRWNNVKTQK